MKKATKIVLWVLLIVLIGIPLLGIILFNFWKYVIITSPKSACSNIERIVSESVQEETGLYIELNPFGSTENCIDSLKKPSYGLVPYSQKMKCLNNANDLSEVQACDEL